MDAGFALMVLGIVVVASGLWLGCCGVEWDGDDEWVGEDDCEGEDDCDGEDECDAMINATTKTAAMGGK